VSGDRANAFLPYEQHPCFDELAEDWIAILKRKGQVLVAAWQCRTNERV